MSTVVVVVDVPGMTSEQYDQVIIELEAARLDKPKSRLHHVAAAKEGGWFVVDIWESAEQFNQFAQQALAPILQKLGAPFPEIQIYPVHNIVKG